MKHIRYFISFLSVMALPLLAATGCSGGDRSPLAGDTIPMRYAEYLTMIDRGGYIQADFRDPWHPDRNLQTYLLVPRDSAIPANLPDGVVVRVPLQKSVVYTSVHSSLINELGSLGSVKGVCDARYIMDPAVQSRVKSGAIADCGSSMSPNIERIIMLGPDAILLSAYEDSSDHNKVAQMGVPIIDCTDYMESSPLGRAEWMRFYGRLYGRGAEADSLFNNTERAYNLLKQKTASVDKRPRVMSDMIYGQSWSVPGSYSTAGVLIEDAGGRNIFDYCKRTGSAQLSPEEVLYRAKDADIWLVKYSAAQPLTLSQLGSYNPVYSRFRPFATGEVYGINTSASSYFDDAAFHPHWVLAEYITLFHPELGAVGDNHHYYSRLKP